VNLRRPAQLAGRLVKTFVRLLDNDSVRPFIPLYYAPFLTWGLYATFFAAPLPLIMTQMGRLPYDIWVWMTIPGTLVCLAGMWLRNGGGPATLITEPLLRRDYLGLWMQFGGHACMAIVLLIYEITGIAGATWGDPVISLFLISSYAVGVPLLAAQCLRKLWRGRQR